MTTANDLYAFAAERGIGIASFYLSKREALSTMDENGESKLAHEIGHCETGSFYNVFSSFDNRQRHENRADVWAIKKLIPKDELKKAVKHGYSEIWELADYFDVTEDLICKAISWYKYGNLYSVRR